MHGPSAGLLDGCRGRLGRMPLVAASVALWAMCAAALAGAPAPVSAPRVVEETLVDKVWSGHVVGFDFLQEGDRQFVVYYDAERNMTLATRKVGEDQWSKKRLPSRTGWDSHNYVTMALDRDKCLHVSGNMHSCPLIYFRGSKPLDIESVEPVKAMVGGHEGSTTYPQFIHDADGRLLFTYRSGGSGNGLNLVNVYDEKAKAWKRLLDQPLFDGTKRSMNAYPPGPPSRGPDGFFHTVWVWRDTPDAATNHTVCYARSRDLVHWETVDGKPVALPITPDNKDVVVDPVSARKGLINMGHGVGFDEAKRPVVNYHKYDGKGDSQIWLARWEDGAWKIRQASSWEHRWQFGGGGAFECQVLASPVRPLGKGKLVQTWRHEKFGSGAWEIDAATLEVTGPAKLPAQFPREVAQPVIEFDGIAVRWQGCKGPSDSPPARYFLRWETLGANRDRARSGPLPPPSELRVLKIAPAGG